MQTSIIPSLRNAFEHVLRFWAYWDDRCQLHGDLRQFTIHYFLSDGTMEVREILRPNSGYDDHPLFVRRGKVPKNCDKLVQLPGMESPLTILNVFGSLHNTDTIHYMVDHLAEHSSGIEYFTDRDLAIGAVLNIFGRAFILTDCDEFTKQFYRQKYNIQDFTPLMLDEHEPTIPKPEPPPYNGWGDEDDSLQSWKSVELHPLIRDYRKYATHEKEILRFEARFHKALQKVNQSRRFVIQYFMSDDTIQIHERDHPNSGLPRGKFLYRTKPVKPGRQVELGEDASFYEFQDFFVGNILDINGFRFQITRADDFTLCYMEANKHLFPQANLCIILDKIREAVGALHGEDILKCFAEKDTCLQGVCSVVHFRRVMMDIMKCSLNEHEVLTLARAYSAKVCPPGTDFKTLQAIAQTELRKFRFDQTLLARAEYTLRYHDPSRTGLVDREHLRSTLKGSRVPLFKELLDYLVDKFPAAEGDLCNRVDYCKFIYFLNWEKNPVPVAKPAPTTCIMKWIEPKPRCGPLCVNYHSLLKDVCPNFNCSLPSICCCNENKPCPQHPEGKENTEPEKCCPDESSQISASCECPPEELQWSLLKKAPKPGELDLSLCLDDAF